MICSRFVRAPIQYPYTAFFEFARPIAAFQLEQGLSEEEAYKETLIRSAILLSRGVEPNTANMTQDFMKDSFIRLNFDLDTVKSSTQRRDGNEVQITIEPHIGDVYAFRLDLHIHQAIAALGFKSLQLESDHRRDSPVTFEHEVRNGYLPTFKEICVGQILSEQSK